MKKYEIKYYLKEKIPGKINDLMLTLLFFEFKNKFLYNRSNYFFLLNYLSNRYIATAKNIASAT